MENKEITIELKFKSNKNAIGHCLGLLDHYITTNEYSPEFKLVQATVSLEGEVKGLWGHGE